MVRVVAADIDDARSILPPTNGKGGFSSHPARRSDRIRQVDQGVAMAPPRGVPRQFPKRFLDTRAQTLLVERVAEDRVGGGGRRAGPYPVEGGAEHEGARPQGAGVGLR